MSDFEIEAIISGHHSGDDIKAAFEKAGGTNIRMSGPGWSQHGEPWTFAWADCGPNESTKIFDQVPRRFPGTRMFERHKP